MNEFKMNNENISIYNSSSMNENIMERVLSAYITDIKEFTLYGIHLTELGVKEKKPKEKLMVSVDVLVETIQKKMGVILSVLINNQDMINELKAEEENLKQKEEYLKQTNKIIHLLSEAYKISDCIIKPFPSVLGEEIRIEEVEINHYSCDLLKGEVMLYLSYFEVLIQNISSILFKGNFLWKKELNLEPIKKFISITKSNIRKAFKEYLGFVEENLLPVAAEATQIDNASIDNQEDISYIAELIQNNQEEQLVQASNREVTFNTNTFCIQASQEEGNKSPFQGVLFPIGQVSESAPAKGSDTPLYVPIEVAREVVDFINASDGLPLDASPDLSGHNDKGVVGIMNKAEIVDNNLIVYGHLFPFNNPEMVSLIKSEKNNLGMSINAIAQGIKTVIDGVNVFSIKNLKPLGANILKAVRATWKNTAVLQASENENEDEDNENNNLNMIDYEKDIYRQNCLNDELNLEETKNNFENSIFNCENKTEDFSMPEISDISLLFERFNDKLDVFLSNTENQIESLRDEIDEHYNQTENLVKAQANLIDSLESQVRDIINEKELVKAQAEEKEKEASLQVQQNQLMENLTKQVTENILSALNPTGQPVRKTQPLVQASAIEDSTNSKSLSDVEKRLIAAEATLKTMEEMGRSGAERIQLLEEIYELRHTLNS